MMMTPSRRTKNQKPASFFDDAFISQGLQPPEDPRPFSERDSIIRTSVGADFANQPTDVATLGRNLAVLGFVPFDDPSVQGEFTETLDQGIRALQKEEQKKKTETKVDGEVSVKTQTVIQRRMKDQALKASPAAPLAQVLPIDMAIGGQATQRPKTKQNDLAAAPKPKRALDIVRSAEAAAAKRNAAGANPPVFADEVDPAVIARGLESATRETRTAAEAAAARHLPRDDMDRRKIRRAADEAAIAAEFDYSPHAPTIAAGASAARAAATEIQTQGMAFRDGTDSAFRMGLAKSGKTPIYDADGAEAVSLPSDEALSEAAVRPLTALMEGMLEDRAAGRPIDIRDAAPFGRQVANILAEAAPGLGEAMSARDAEIAGALALEAYENDELRDLLIYSVQTGVAAIGAIPLLGSVVRAPKKALEAAALVISRVAKDKPPKFAAAAKEGRISDGVEVMLDDGDGNLPPLTLKFEGGAAIERLRVLDAARDHIARDDVKIAIYKLIDGGAIKSDNDTRDMYSM
jgi:hypothetical protein